MRRLFLICIFFSLTDLQAQKVQLLSRADSLPVAYAHIIGENYRAVSTLEGTFVLPSRISGLDTLRISCVGFERIRMVRPAGDTTIYLEPSLTELLPVVITGLSIAQRLFRVVDRMKWKDPALAGREAVYWRGVFEEDGLKERFAAGLAFGGETWQADTVYAADGCSSFDLTSLSDAFSMFDQNHVSPPLAALKRSNEGLWQYELARQYLEGDELITEVHAAFYSPERHVEHSFRIWMNEDRNQLLRLEFSYKWNLKFPVTLNDQRGLTSNLKRYQGHVLFADGLPLYLDARYLLEVCDKFSKNPCREQEVYHEFFLRDQDLGILPVNVSFFEYINGELACDNDL